MMLAKDMSYPKLLVKKRCIAFGVESQHSYLRGSQAPFQSYEDFISRIDEMVRNQSMWEGRRFSKSLAGNSDEHLFARGVKYWVRDPLVAVQEILENKSLVDKCVWAPRKIINSEGERVYTDLHDTDWWWDMQVVQILREEADRRVVFQVHTLNNSALYSLSSSHQIRPCLVQEVEMLQPGQSI
jgi:hypothetical protein